MTVARAMAAIAGAHITALTSLEHQRTLAVQLQNALDSRVVLEQAKGVLAASAGIGMDEAFTRMRRHARRRSVTLASVADAVVKLGLRPDR
jgi:AmiR/NasT family two-component response regulator